MSKGFLFTFLAATAWAIAIVITKITLQNGENVFNLAFWTALLAIPYWLIVLSQNHTEAKKMRKSDIGILIAIGLVSTVGVGITEALALKYSTAINYSFLIRTVILFTFVFAYFFLDEKLTLKKIVLAVVLLAGAFLLTTNGQGISFTLGDIFTLIEAALIAFGNNILGKLATNRMSPFLSAAGGFLVGIIPLALIAWMNSAIALPRSFPLILALTLASIALTTLRFYAYKNASAAAVTMVFSVTPVLVALMAIPLLKETMTPIQLLGGILIILAGIGVEKFKI